MVHRPAGRQACLGSEQLLVFLKSLKEFKLTETLFHELNRQLDRAGPG